MKEQYRPGRRAVSNASGSPVSLDIALIFWWLGWWVSVVLMEWVRVGGWVASNSGGVTSIL